MSQYPPYPQQYPPPHEPNYYPPIPPSAPPLSSATPPSHHHSHHHHSNGSAPPPPPPPPVAGPGPTAVYVAPPRIEMQPWAKDVWRWLVDNTQGVARVDLRRPTVPLPEQYDGNLLVVRPRGAPEGRGRFGGRRQAAQPPIMTPMYGQVVYDMPGNTAAATGRNMPTGARIKITRSFIVGGPKQRAKAKAKARAQAASDGGREASSSSSDELEEVKEAVRGLIPDSLRRRLRMWADKPLLDMGVGVNLDMDLQQIQPVARIKIKDFMSLSAAPMGLLKLSHSFPIGPVALKVRYELPLEHSKTFWQPPARLLVRLDNAAGSGVHLTASGLEFDEQVVRFGSNVSMRASAALNFPRQLPLQEGEPPFELRVHRLSLKSIW
ncbi:hypothetical protein HYH03_001326 [Edaphochlamys debaryana]|uniref:Uncharacterized protein n=1 Tax=Edaphochlamys debaryana TaxID=47281 RepID=A0A835YMT2_9CHLO|nr:hypothetical protein HYH03_001326 [Edaphochlamys debaryana]|eukprot:KAG2500554.1 hypothetical protein HYH03_001326 [Edaphochlamys debaryana]